MKIKNYNIILFSILFIFAIIISLIIIPSYAKEEINYITVSNIESLKNTKNLSIGDLVKTKGYYTAGDGGEGLYKIVKTTGSSTNPRIIKINNNSNIVAVLQTSNETYINVKQMGVKSGITNQTSKTSTDTNIRDNNTKIINNVLSNYTSQITLFFPSGRYLLSNLNISKNNNVKIEGMSNSFGSVFNYKKGDIYSVLIFDSNNDNPVVKLNSVGVNITINNIGIYGSFYKCTNGLRRDSCSDDNPVFGSKNNVFISGNNNGKLIKITNSSFVQWGTVIGNEYENDVTKKTLTKSGVNNLKVEIERTRFTLNSIAISNVTNSKITYTSLNSNDYPFVFDGNYGNTTISHCRVEWSRANGYYIRGTKDGAPSNITIDNNEFDRSYWALIYITYNTNKPTGIKVINNNLRRAGAELSSEREKSVQLWVDGCKNCEFKYNYTKKMCNNDTSCSGPGKGVVPKYVSTFKNCENTVVQYNDLTGGTSTNNDLNIIKNCGSLTQSDLSKKNIID